MTVSYFDERQAIHERMEEIKLERRCLTDEYYQLKGELHELDERDRQDQERGFSFVAPFDVNAAIASLNESVATLKSLVPDVSLEQVMEVMKERLATQFTALTEEISTTKRTFMSAQQEYDSTRTLKKTRADYVGQAPTVVNVLKEFGRPVGFLQLYQTLKDDHGIDWSNRYVGINRIMEVDPRIQKIGTGKGSVYQFNPQGGL